MASHVNNKGLREALADYYLVATLKVMLLGTATAYTPNPDHDFVDMAGANDPVDSEINVSGYTRGFGGAGRKTLASVTVTEDDTNNRVEIDCADPSWTALGTGDTVAAAQVIEEITNDAASLLIAYLDITDTPTNGSDFTLQMPADGFINFNT